MAGRELIAGPNIEKRHDVILQTHAVSTSPNACTHMPAAISPFGPHRSMVYPTLIAAVSDASHPSWRARSLSVYRFWRDLGYAIGALCAGIIADVFGMQSAIVAIGGITFASGAVVASLMKGRE